MLTYVKSNTRDQSDPTLGLATTRSGLTAVSCFKQPSLLRTEVGELFFSTIYYRRGIIGKM